MTREIGREEIAIADQNVNALVAEGAQADTKALGSLGFIVTAIVAVAQLKVLSGAWLVGFVSVAVLGMIILGAAVLPRWKGRPSRAAALRGLKDSMEVYFDARVLEVENLERKVLPRKYQFMRVGYLVVGLDVLILAGGIIFK